MKGLNKNIPSHIQQKPKYQFPLQHQIEQVNKQNTERKYFVNFKYVYEFLTIYKSQKTSRLFDCSTTTRKPNNQHDTTSSDQNIGT